MSIRKHLLACVAAVSMIASSAAPANAATDPLTEILNGVFGAQSHVTVKVDRFVYHGKHGYRVSHNGRKAIQHSSVSYGQPYQSGSGHSVMASFYGHGEKLSSHTANGERFNPYAMTAAHRSLPFGSLVRVSYGGRSVVVRINDRGPAAWTGRSIDLSYGAARNLGCGGVCPVAIARLD